ncbi:transposable element Tcb1 transposase [Trichonephila clavipes]|nr:transposable element Tcb1 transposase [Trichonephila clavipes]
MAAATLEDALQTGAHSLVKSTTNIGARMLKRHFLEESRFCLQHQDDHISIWWCRDEGILVACIRLRHTGPSTGSILCDTVRCTFQSPLLRIDIILNNARYISGVLWRITLHFISALRNPTFQQDNARAHVTGIVRTLFDT